MVFFNFIPLGCVVFLMTKFYLRAIRVGRFLRPEAWMMLAIGGGTFTLYWAWAVDRWLRTGPMGNEGAGFSLSPTTIVDYMIRFHEKGYWGWGIAWYYDHAPVTGGALTVWWTLEAALIFLLPSGLVWSFLRRHPLCERCSTWMMVNAGVRRLQGSRATKIHEGIRSGDFATLEEPDRPQKGDPFTLRIDVAKCEICPDAVYLNLVHEDKILLWMHPFPIGQLQKVFKSARPKGHRPPPPTLP
jgi:hypothetical protein